ncbi:MAG: hypothetical protein RIS75_457, partial [Actinomycetota bacterium]
KEKVSRYAANLFQDVKIDSDGDLVISYESTIMFVRVIERDLDQKGLDFYNKFSLSTTVIRVWAVALVELKPSAELFKWVATEGQEFFYGAFYLNESKDGTYELVFQLNLPGDELDQGELNSALISIANGADDLDEELQKRFGGKRIADL